MVVDFRLVLKLLGQALVAVGCLSFIPMAYAYFNELPGGYEFGLTGLVTVGAGVLLTRSRSSSQAGASIRELFLFTALLWITITLMAAVPLYLLVPDLSAGGALFESASGLSTTGATVLDKLESRPQSVLLWRSLLQFIGGIGFVVIAVAVLPNAAMGGMNLFKTESSSFDGSSKITPHVKTMALSFLLWYLLTLVLCSFLYILGGFDPFVAINAAMCTVSTGGMMPLDASMNGASPFIQYTAIVFMFLGSLPFMLIIGSIFGSFSTLLRDQQVRGFCVLALALTLAVYLALILINGYDPERALRVALFNVISIISSTGFALEDFSQWNRFATALFFIVLALGGCSGSTAGGIKIFRMQICFSMFKAQLVKTIHPHQIIEPRFNHKVIDSETLRSVITYLVAYVMVTMLSAALASCLGLELLDAISATTTCLSNIGPVIGQALTPSGNFSALSDSLHVLFACDMIIGRLEILPVLLCLTRLFWRR